MEKNENTGTRNEFVLKRHPANPIIVPKDFPGGRADAVFNAGQTMFNGKTILLLSVRKAYEKPCSVHVAESSDGAHFRINPKPFITMSDKDPIKSCDQGGVLDTRVTRIDDTYYIIRPGGTAMGVAGILGKTKDFVHYEDVEVISLPDNRVPCLFPEKIGGCYVRLDRPCNRDPKVDTGWIWISYSPDLIHWGRHRPLLKPFTFWNYRKIGPTPPIRTEKGWLEIYHGVYESCSGSIYSIGAMLLDLNDPSIIIGKTNGYILTPDAPYEFQGRVPNVVFPCGAIADYDKRQLRLYYGCADTCIGLATGSLDELLEACLKGQ